MEMTIRIPDSLVRGDESGHHNFHGFLQAVANRRTVGSFRYDAKYGFRPSKRQRYLTRLRKELRTYSRTGNFENLLNVAVYCFLESEAPQNKRFHFAPEAASATRRELDG